MFLESEFVTYGQGEYAVPAVLDAVRCVFVQSCQAYLIACVNNDRRLELIRNTYRDREVELLKVVLVINIGVYVCVSVYTITKISLAFCMKINL